MPQRMHTSLRPATRALIVGLVLSPLALAVPRILEEPDRANPRNPRNEEADAAVVEPMLPARAPHSRTTIDQARPVLGFAINAHYIKDVQLYLKTVDRIAALGANAIVVLTPMYQPYADSNQIAPTPEKCATDEQLIAILRHSRERGMHTTLLPIVLIEHPGEKDWRGLIRPTDWDQWWESYDRFIDRFLDVANQADVDLLVVGSELNSTEDQTERWRHVVERVRQRFGGQIAYSANWDRYDKINFWPMLDVMCVSSYFELARENPNAPESELVEAWGKERDKLVKFAAQWDRPLVLSEVGYPSLPWASAHPWNYVTKEGSKADHEAQARCWRAFFKAWTETFITPRQPAAGFFGYFWSPYYHGDAWDTGYGIEGKPSYEIVKAGFAQIRDRSPRPKID